MSALKNSNIEGKWLRKAYLKSRSKLLFISRTLHPMEKLVAHLMSGMFPNPIQSRLHLSWPLPLNTYAKINILNQRDVQFTYDIPHLVWKTGLLKYVKEISTSSAFINILITVVTKPPRFAETGVFGTLPWADTVVFTGVRVTRMFLAPFRRSEARHFHVGFQGFTQPFLEVERDRVYKLRMNMLSKKNIIRGWKKKGVVMGWLWTRTR